MTDVLSIAAPTSCATTPKTPTRHDLVDDPKHAELLGQMRQLLLEQMRDTHPTLRAGDLILARELYRLDGSPFYWGQDQLGDPILPDHALMAQARNAVEMAGIDSRLGSLISLPVVAKTAGMKVWIGEKLGALGVDMESYSIGEEADRAQIPFAAVRSVVDSVSVNLPDLVGQVDQQPIGGRLVPAMKYLLRHPLGIGPLTQLGRSAGTARNSLTIFCSEFIAELPGT